MSVYTQTSLRLSAHAKCYLWAIIAHNNDANSVDQKKLDWRIALEDHGWEADAPADKYRWLLAGQRERVSRELMRQCRNRCTPVEREAAEVSAAKMLYWDSTEIL